MSAQPLRIAWALEVIAPKPSDRLLEIGCGQGLAVAALCEGLTSGTILAIDRSATMIAAARRRNQNHERDGKATFATMALADMPVGQQRFDKVFAINVNLFWRDAAREVAIIRSVLAPRGRLHLVFEPPTAAQVGRIAKETVARLEAGGFSGAVVRKGTGTTARLIHVSAA
ncbi:class I SAM-dependent methyltransferase [Reyranella sp.]|uniref:class I SAM-dependent methyltransferase n=1 Tax=Reyranella sp. TaxID=1929291 RepID=UPI0025FA4999|nr:class I SAM-dependent methyltransferase [Reyranella sp.]